MHWSGWETDTYRLKQENWSFYANEGKDQESRQWRLHLVASSPDAQLAISGVKYLEFGDVMGGHSRWAVEELVYGGFRMNHYTIKDFHRSVEFDPRSWFGLQEVDIKATTFAPRESVYFLKDLKVFKPVETFSDKAIYIPTENVDDLFNKILQIQFKESKLQKKLLVPDTQPVIQAKIFSL